MVVIVPPLLYVASLSVLNFLVSLLVGFGLWLVISGVSSRRIGNRNVFEWFETGIRIVGEFVLGLVCAGVGIWLLNPVTIMDAGFVGLFSFAGFAVLGLLFSFKRLRLLQDTEKKSMVVRFLVAAIVVGVIVTGGVALSIEVKPISKDRYSSDSYDPLVLPSLSAPMAKGIWDPLSESDTVNEHKTKSFDSSSFWVWAQTGSSCTVSDENHSITLELSFSCGAIESGRLVRVHCPVLVTGFDETNSLLSDNCGVWS